MINAGFLAFSFSEDLLPSVPRGRGRRDLVSHTKGCEHSQSSTSHSGKKPFN